MLQLLLLPLFSLLFLLLLLLLLVVVDVLHQLLYRLLINNLHQVLARVKHTDRLALAVTHEQSAEVIIAHVEERQGHRRSCFGGGRFRVHELLIDVPQRPHPLQLHLQFALLLVVEYLCHLLIRREHKVLKVVLDRISRQRQLLLVVPKRHIDVDPVLVGPVIWQLLQSL